MELRKNSNAKKKPYFGRIDYQDKKEEEEYSFYLGKNGVMKNQTDMVVIRGLPNNIILFFLNSSNNLS